MRYTGDPSDVCAISHIPVSELKRPVGFESKHAFECECIVEWLTEYQSTNPVTGQQLGGVPVRELLRPIIVGGRDEHVAETQQALEKAGGTKGIRRCWTGRLTQDVYMLMMLIFMTIGNECALNVCFQLIVGAFICAQNPALGVVVVGIFYISTVVILVHAWALEMLNPKATAATVLLSESGGLFISKLLLDLHDLWFH